MKNKTINSESVVYLKSLINKDTPIVNLEVKGKWLCATLDMGTPSRPGASMTFSILNYINYAKR